MIIAHGPLGYLIAYSTKRWWQKCIAPLQRKWIYLAGLVGGIFPDVDLFYFYLVDSTVSHRQFITHSLIPYTVLLTIALCLLKFLPKHRLVWLAVIFFCFGAFSHISADMLIGMAAILNPLSQEMVGLVSIPWYRDSWFIRYNLVTNFTAEFIIIVLAIGTFIRKQWWWFASSIATILVTMMLYWLSQHNYKPDGYFYYSDQDHDGLMNAYDRDLDNDGLLNNIDTDIDQDGEDNGLEIYIELFSAEGSLFDYSYSHLIEVPLRLGLVNPPVLINRLFANVGLFFGEEMVTDYEQNPDGYRSVPTDNTFSETPDNWIVWLSHTERLLPADANLQEYDIVFFQSGHVALFTRDQQGNDVVLDVHPSHPYTKYLSLGIVAEREGGIQYIGRIMPKPAAKQY